ncbi:Rhodanese-related sulfurtransferase [Hoeflea phototrophica DFL-43]|uniref:Rhodanese-related sulfurtransferase n=1 Tax=Hoeflea phototrophica (strain DSM 17068 / NCIMB 14078 / DFL-43) TaxID=411684 RepID=A9D4Y1_HOEPD|nr:rhodanese-like domain-containing protein [Hoeflea phototrophica]EDQ33986.2 Rhodanese-related sulfurtransferase [Hoeflea phototrophica DFL-43]
MYWKQTRRQFLGAAAMLMITPHPAAASGLRDVTPRDAYEALETDPSIVVLDIRTPFEFKRGHIEGAINIDFYAKDFADRIMALEPGRTYVMYCHAGGRSHALMRAFTRTDFKDVMHIPAGFSGWRRERLPYVR